jgi:hypothetical protein
VFVDFLVIFVFIDDKRVLDSCLRVFGQLFVLGLGVFKGCL